MRAPRTGRNVKQLVHRAIQIATSEPAGPVYLTGPREVMEEQLTPHAADPAAEQNPVLAAADVLLVLDSDIPYIESNSKPSDDATIYVVDIDPLKSGMSLWHVPAKRSAAANSKVAVRQIAAAVRENGFDLDLVAERRARVTAEHDAQRAAWDALERPQDGVITPVPHAQGAGNLPESWRQPSVSAAAGAAAYGTLAAGTGR